MVKNKTVVVVASPLRKNFWGRVTGYAAAGAAVCSAVGAQAQQVLTNSVDIGGAFSTVSGYATTGEYMAGGTILVLIGLGAFKKWGRKGTVG